MRKIAIGLAVLIGVAAGCEPADRDPEAEVRAETDPAAGDAASLLVSSEWLERHLDDAAVLVVHVGGTEAEYEANHIPGARFLPLSSVSVEQDGLMGQLPSVEELEAVVAELGVTGTRRVVFYGAPLAAARAFVAMDVLGLGERAALLDGGLPAWREERRPLTGQDGQALSADDPDPTDDPDPAAPGRADPRTADDGPRAPSPATRSSPQPERVVDADWVNEQRERPDVVLLDARPPEQYTGEVAGDDVPRAGHIPGARNIFWENTLVSVERPTLRDPASLERLFEEAGVRPGVTVVTYCRSGLQSSFLYFVSRYLGHETRLYDGSFMDWSRRSELPVETGAEGVVPGLF
jgi:thiosulfate/3-mercaptopyruvate sulfurtransferase